MQIKNKLTTLWAIASLLFLFMPSMLTAKHIIGGEVTYECLGPSSGDPSSNTYIITMKIYRDCDPNAGGAFFDQPAVFGIYQGSFNDSYLERTIFESPNIVNIEPDTPKCIQNVPYVCVEEGIYSFTVDLPISANDSYFIVYQRCCRNNSIVNIYNPEDVGATYYVEITPKSQQLCNNSPVYNDFPPIIICKDVPLIFDHSATDPDGDQLVYSFCAPEIGGGKGFTGDPCEEIVPNPPCGPESFMSVPFIQPQYSPSNPMGGDPQVTINPVTGLITGTPNKIGRFVVGVCVDEYRNGVKLSSVKRDFQFNVADCDPTVLAKIDGGDTLVFTQGGYYLNTCGGKELYIENKSIDINFIEKFEWRFDLLGTPYLNDSDWSPTINFPESGRYFGKLYLNPGAGLCSDTANIIVDIFPEVTADFSFKYDTCVADAVQFTDLSTSEGEINKWEWQFGVPNGVSSLQNPAYLYTIPGDFPIRLKVTDKNQCDDVINKTINYYPAPPYIIIQPDKYKGCIPADISFTNLSAPIDNTYDIKWYFGDGTDTSGVISPTHIYPEAGTYDVRVEITSPLGCFVSDSFPALIKTYEPPIADFTYTPEELDIFNPLVTFVDQSKDAERWYWKFDRFDYSNKQNPTFSFPDTGLMRVLLIVTHPEGCKDSTVQFIDIKPVVQWFMPNAFTPNGDGTNDGFLGKGIMRGATNFNMSIWNRWGELVFATEDPLEFWTGRAQQTGGMSPNGVYVYTVTFTGPRGEKFEYKGYATLIR